MTTQVIPATAPTPDNPAGTPEIHLNMLPATPEDINRDALARAAQRFMSHTATQAQVEDMDTMRKLGFDLAEHVIRACPPVAERNVIIRKLHEVTMLANALIVTPQ